MRPTDEEPDQQEIEELAIGEERRLISNVSVPDEVKSEIDERLERFKELDTESERAEDAGNAP